MGLEKFKNVKKWVKNSELEYGTGEKDGKLLVGHISNVNQVLRFEEKKVFGECSIICIAFILDKKETEFDSFRKAFLKKLGLKKNHLKQAKEKEIQKQILTYEIAFFFIKITQKLVAIQIP